jgi:hypothetical protein
MRAPYWGAMRLPWLVLGLLAGGLIAACSAGQPGDGAQRRGEQSEAGSVELTWTAPIEVAAGPAYRGPWRANDSEFHFVDDPAVAIDDGGRIAVVWANQEDQDVFIQSYDAAGDAVLDMPVNVSSSPDTFSWLPRVAIPVGDPRRVYVLWQEIVFSGGSHGGEIFFARSTDSGRSFETPVNLSGTSAGDGKGRLSVDRWDNGSLDLVVGAEGTIHVAWTEYEGVLWYRRSTDGGQTFDMPVHIAGDATVPARAPALAAAPDGAVHLVWSVGEDPAADVRLVTSTDGGVNFGAPTLVASSDGHADAPKLVVDGEGTLHVVYAEASPHSPDRYHIMYSRRPPGARAFEHARVISRTDTNGVDHVGFPSLAIDAADNLYVVWERFPTRHGSPLGLGFSYSPDGGRTFGLPSVVPGTADSTLGVNGSLQGLLMRKLAVAGDGAIAVVNSSFREGEISRVRLIRGRVDRPRATLGSRSVSTVDQLHGAINH